MYILYLLIYMLLLIIISLQSCGSLMLFNFLTSYSIKVFESELLVFWNSIYLAGFEVFMAVTM
jgi:hypothetical protein